MKIFNYYKKNQLKKFQSAVEDIDNSQYEIIEGNVKKKKRQIKAHPSNLKNKITVSFYPKFNEELLKEREEINLRELI